MYFGTFKNWILTFRDAFVRPGINSCVFYASEAQSLQQKNVDPKVDGSFNKNGKMPATFRKIKGIQGFPPNVKSQSFRTKLLKMQNVLDFE